MNQMRKGIRQRKKKALGENKNNKLKRKSKIEDRVGRERKEAIGGNKPTEVMKQWKAAVFRS